MEKKYTSRGTLDLRFFPEDFYLLMIERFWLLRFVAWVLNVKLPKPAIMLVRIMSDGLLQLSVNIQTVEKIFIPDAIIDVNLGIDFNFQEAEKAKVEIVGLNFYPRFFLGETKLYFEIQKSRKQKGMFNIYLFPSIDAEKWQVLSMEKLKCG